MKITKLNAWVADLTLTEPYTIAYEEVSSCQNVFLELETDTGITGYGCAAPDLQVTQETAETVMQGFNEVVEPLLKGESVFKYTWTLENLKKELYSKRPSSSCLAMVDMALYDLMAKKTDEPLYKILGGYRESIPTSITIGILPIGKTLRRAAEYRQRGFSIFKLKGGINVDEDIEKVLKLRETFGAEIELRFDANQGYSVKDAIKFISSTQGADVELLEQPTDRNNEPLLQEVSENVPVPVMADESLMTLKDAFRLTKNDRIDMINIKLMKTGGILEALHINSVAKAAGVEAMIGCMDESELGISAGLHFALSRSNIMYADLDGHLDIENDPFMGCFTLKDGILYPNGLPGLGVLK